MAEVIPQGGESDAFENWAATLARLTDDAQHLKAEAAQVLRKDILPILDWEEIQALIDNARGTRAILDDARVIISALSAHRTEFDSMTVQIRNVAFGSYVESLSGVLIDEDVRNIHLHKYGQPPAVVHSFGRSADMDLWVQETGLEGGHPAHALIGYKITPIDAGQQG